MLGAAHDRRWAVRARRPRHTGRLPALAGLAAGFGRSCRVGVAGTGAYGAGLARCLSARGLTVVEVARPDRKTRRVQGKSDPIDALAAALAALIRCRPPACRRAATGPVEAIRDLLVALRGAVEPRTAAIDGSAVLVAAAPDDLRAGLRRHDRHDPDHRCADLRRTGPAWRSRRWPRMPPYGVAARASA